MDQMRLLLALVLSFLVFMLWNVFFGQEPQKKPIPQLQSETRQEGKSEPAVSAAPPAETKPALESTASAPAPLTEKPARLIKVETPLYQVTLSERGAGIIGFMLKKYRETAEADSPLKNLFLGNGADNGLFVGLAGKAPGLEKAVFQGNFAGDQMSLTDGSREIVFNLKTASGIHVEKVYRFYADSYAIGFAVRVLNSSEHPIKDSLFVGLRNAFPAKKSSSVFEGPSAMVQGEVNTITPEKLKEMVKEKKSSSGDIQWIAGDIQWLALESRYFVTNVIPLKQQSATVWLADLSDSRVEARYVEQEVTFEPGNRREFDFQLFFGPKSMDEAIKAGYGRWDRTVDLLAKPCLWLLNFFYSHIPNYGVAIIILTVLTKIILWPLGTKSYKSMSQMKKLQPLIQGLREKYKNDRKKMNEEIMRLHRTYNINPLGGCLPMLVQIPVFFALYRMLDQAIELRHAPFFGWINDLSAPDRLFRFNFSVPFMEPPYGIPVLTLVMGATMFWQQKMTPPAGDPTQAKMMMLMPVVFTGIFVNFSSGLVLYWLVNNVLSIGQQYYIQKKFG